MAGAYGGKRQGAGRPKKVPQLVSGQLTLGQVAEGQAQSSQRNRESIASRVRQQEPRKEREKQRNEAIQQSREKDKEKAWDINDKIHHLGTSWA
jgi:hypothetical protein